MVYQGASHTKLKQDYQDYKEWINDTTCNSLNDYALDIIFYLIANLLDESLYIVQVT